MQVNDKRQDKTKKVTYWVVATDRVLSGWGQARGGKSYVAYPLTGLTDRQQKRVIDWVESRTNYRNVRTNLNLPRGKSRDHLSIYDPPAELLDKQ